MSVLTETFDDDTDTATETPASKPDRRSRLWSRARWVALALMAITAFGFWARGRGYGNWIKQRVGFAPVRVLPPLCVSSRPANGSLDVDPAAEITIRVKTRAGELEASTVTAANILMRRPDEDLAVPHSVRLETAADGVPVLVVKATKPLDGGAKYVVEVTDRVRDVGGSAVVPHTLTFTTGSQADPSIRFEQVPLPTAAGLGAGFTCVQMGPDGFLWAGLDDGRILRYPIESAGTLGKPVIFTSLQAANGGSRLLTGFCFDPASTADAPILWVTHGWHGFTNAPDLSGKVTRVSGPGLKTVEDKIIGLPRSVRDHLTNQPSFGPDGALYVPQPSNSAFGAPDAEWGNRPERRLNSAILRIETPLLPVDKPLDVRTVDAGGSYDPTAPGAPLTVYATGVRLAYDLLWHSNGKLYAPVNGSSPGGNAPAGDGVPGISPVPEPEHDWFFHITPGRYYGHPNPVQGHFVVNGGNPTAGEDFAELKQYPVGTKPDAKWTPAIYDFGNHVSPNGVIEYKADVFGGKLKGKILVCRYNGGSDILCLDLTSDGTDVRSAHLGIPGLSKLANPLDLTADPKTGCIYVSEYGAQKITLLRPVK